MGELFQLPPNISTFGERIDWYYNLIVWVTAIVFVGVQAALIWFVIRFRHRAGRRAEYSHGNNRLEWTWTIATAVVVFAIGLSARPLWLDIKDPRRFPEPGLELIVTAKQFEWNVTYPGADGQIRTGDDFVVRNQLHVPVNVPVRFTLNSEDVIHSFYVPELRLKQDAVPGMNIPVWFEATQTGEWTLGCAELCGLQHYRMRASFYVHTADEFAAWHASRAAGGGVGAAAAGNGDGVALAGSASAAHVH